MSVSSASSGVEGSVSIELNPGHGDGSCDRDARGMIQGLWNEFNHPATRSEALSGILCHLKPLESCILQSEKIKTAVEAAIEDPGSFTDYTALEVAADPPMVPRDVARKWIESAFLYSPLCVLYSQKLQNIMTAIRLMAPGHI